MLLVPDPAYALRQLNAGAEEGNPVNRELTRALSIPVSAGTVEAKHHSNMKRSA